MWIFSLARSCAYHNGGCHENGTCEEYAGSVTCTCPQGYVGDGHHCVRPCDDNNGGCHPLAVCKEIVINIFYLLFSIIIYDHYELSFSLKYFS